METLLVATRAALKLAGLSEENITHALTWVAEHAAAYSHAGPLQVVLTAGGIILLGFGLYVFLKAAWAFVFTNLTAAAVAAWAPHVGVAGATVGVAAATRAANRDLLTRFRSTQEIASQLQDLALLVREVRQAQEIQGMEAAVDRARVTSLTVENQDLAANNAQLTNDVKALCTAESQKDTDVSRLCVVCLASARSTSYKPCNHMATCLPCTTKLINVACPVCRVKIEGHRPVYHC